jgi:hypothetical protein
MRIEELHLGSRLEDAVDYENGLRESIEVYPDRGN